MLSDVMSDENADQTISPASLKRRSGEDPDQDIAKERKSKRKRTLLAIKGVDGSSSFFPGLDMV